MPEPSELYEALYRLTDTFVDMLRRDGSANPELIHVTGPGFIRDEEGEWSIVKDAPKFEVQPLAPEPFRRYARESIARVEDACPVVGTMINDRVIQHQLPRDEDGEILDDGSGRQETRRRLASKRIREFLEQYLLAGRTGPIDQEAFDAIYPDFEAHLLSDHTRLRATLPILRFSSDTSCIRFSEDVRLRRLQRNEINRLATKLRPGVVPLSKEKLPEVRRLFDSEFAIEVDYRQRKAEPLSSAPACARAGQVITALRLYKPGDVMCNLVLLGPASPFDTRTVWTPAQWQHPLLPPTVGPPLHLKAGEEQTITEVWQNLEHIRSGRGYGDLDVAIRKFNDIYPRRLLEDKILDMSILLESTLLWKIREELKYRLQLRGAHLLSPDEPPKQTFANLRRLYDFRSAIVHDGKSLGDLLNWPQSGEKPSEFVDEMMSLCRKVLRELLSRMADGESLHQIVTGLDDAAMGIEGDGI